MKIKFSVILILSLLITGCGIEWSDSDKFTKLLTCGIDINDTKDMAENNELDVQQTTFDGVDIVVVSKNGDYIWVFFDDKKKLISVSKPNWPINIWGVIAGGPSGEATVFNCRNGKINDS